MENLVTIAKIHSAFPTKFGIPRQAGLVDSLQATVVFEPEYRNPDALRGLEDFSHLWLLWRFSEAKQEGWSPTVRPPRLGGNTRMGVFATRAPYRPNPIGLSAVRLEKITQHPQHGPVLHVLGADLMDGTPIYDIKPYIPYADSHPEAIAGFAHEAPTASLTVDVDNALLQKLPDEQRAALLEVLAQDPRPRYQNDPARVYGMEFAGFEVKFTVQENSLTVTEITPE